jgi:hypothetical protein
MASPQNKSVIDFFSDLNLGQTSDPSAVLPEGAQAEPYKSEEAKMVQTDEYGASQVETVPEEWLFAKGQMGEAKEATLKPETPLIIAKDSANLAENVTAPSQELADFKNPVKAFFSDINFSTEEIKSDVDIQLSYDQHVSAKQTEQKVQAETKKKYSSNPKIHFAIKSLKNLEYAQNPGDREDQLYSILSLYILEESYSPHRPLDEEISESKKETMLGMGRAVGEKSGGVGKDQFLTGGFNPFNSGVQDVVDFSEEEYQDYLAADIARKSGIDFAKLNKHLVETRQKHAEKSTYMGAIPRDMTVDTRYADGQLQNISADVLNVPLGLMQLSVGAADAKLNNEQTGLKGELLDTASKAANNLQDIYRYTDYLEKGQDVFTIQQAFEQFGDDEVPVTNLDALGKISIRSGRYEIASTGLFVPESLPTDVNTIIQNRKPWEEKAIQIIANNIASLDQNEIEELDATLALSPTVFIPDAFGEVKTKSRRTEQAAVISDMLFAAMFTESPEKALSRFPSKVIENVPLPAKGDTLGKRIASTANAALALLNEEKTWEDPEVDKYIGVDPFKPKPSQRNLSQQQKDDYEKIFVDQNGAVISLETAKKFNEEKVENFVRDYIRKELFKEAEKQARAGKFGKAYFSPSDTKDMRETKIALSALLAVLPYEASLPNYNTTSEEYFSRVADGFGGIPADMLISFQALDVLVRGIEKKGNKYVDRFGNETDYTKKEIDAVKNKVKDDLAYILMDWAAAISIAGSFAQGSKTLGTSAAKAVSTVPKPGSLLNARDMIKYLKDVINETKIQREVQIRLVKDQATTPITREDATGFAEGTDFTSSKAIKSDGKGKLLSLEQDIKLKKSKLEELNNKVDRNPDDIAKKELEIKIKENELRVEQDFQLNKFENFENQPTRGATGFDEYTRANQAEGYRDFKRAQTVERQSARNSEEIYKKLSEKEQIKADKISEKSFDRIIRNSPFPRQLGKNGSIFDPFAPQNAKKVLNYLQSSGVTDYGIYRFFINKSRNTKYKTSSNTVGDLIAGTKVGLFKKSKETLRETLGSMFSPEDLARMNNTSLTQELTLMQRIAAGDDLAAKGITNPFAYSRLGLTDAQISYYIQQAMKVVPDPKMTVVKVTDEFTILTQTKKQKRQASPPSFGLRKSRFSKYGPLLADSASRLFFGPGPTNLWKNNSRFYAVTEYMKRPFAFINIPRNIQNFLSENLLYLNTMGMSDGFWHSWLSNFVTPENMIGTTSLYNLLSITGNSSTDLRQMDRLIKRIPGAEGYVISNKKAREIFNLTKDEVPDLAKINQADFDLIVQSAMSRDSVKIVVNGEDIVINDLFELQVNQTGKLNKDIAKLTKRIEKLKSESPLYKKLWTRRDRLKKKVESGDVYVNVEKVYGNLPEKRAELSKLNASLQKNPTDRILLMRKSVLESEIADLAAVTPEEAISGIGDLRWVSKREFKSLSPTAKAVYAGLLDIVTPLQEKIYNVIGSIMSAEDTLILAQKNSPAMQNVVVKITDDGPVPVKVFEQDNAGKSNAIAYKDKLNAEAGGIKGLDDVEQTRVIEESLKDVGKQNANPVELYQVMSVDELAANGQIQNVPLLKRAWDTPATNLPSLMTRYMTIVVDAASLAVAAKEMFRHSTTLSPANAQRLIQSWSRRMLMGFDNGSDLIVKYGTPEKALQALLESGQEGQKAQLGRSLTPSETFYSSQAMGSVSSQAELLTITANSKYRVSNTYKGLLVNQEYYRIMNSVREQGGLLTASEFNLLMTKDPRAASRFISLDNVYAREPGFGAFLGVSDLFELTLDAASKFRGKSKKPKAKTVGSKKNKDLGIFGNKGDLYISKEHAMHFSDMAGLVSIGARLDQKLLSYIKQSRILSFTSGIMPVQIMSSLMYHATMIARTPGAMFNTWVFANASSIFQDVVRVKLGLKPKNHPGVEEAARAGIMQTSADWDFNPGGSFSEAMFIAEALEEAGKTVAKSQKSNVIDNFAERVLDIYKNSSVSSSLFAENLKVAWDLAATKPRNSQTGQRVASVLATTKETAGKFGSNYVKGLKFSYTLLEDFLKTIYSMSLAQRTQTSIKSNAPEAVKTMFHYGNLSRNANAMRYGMWSPFASNYAGYLANAAYAFPEIFANAPIRAQLAGYAMMIHNQSAIDTIGIYNEITEMRLAMGDVFAFAYVDTAVAKGDLSKKYGPSNDSSLQTVRYGQSTGSMARVEGSSGFGWPASYYLFRDPDARLTFQSASRGMFSSPAMDLLMGASDLVDWAFGEEDLSFTEQELADDKAAFKVYQETLKLVEQQQIEKTGKPFTDQEKTQLNDWTKYINEQASSDFAHPVYKFFRKLIPVEVANIWAGLPSTSGIAPDRALFNLSNLGGIKAGIADMTKVQDANVLSKSSINSYVRQLKTLQKKLQAGDTIPKALKLALQEKISAMSMEMLAFEKDSSKVKKLNEQQTQAIKNLKSSLFSLWMAAESDIFLKERTEKGFGLR